MVNLRYLFNKVWKFDMMLSITFTTRCTKNCTHTYDRNTLFYLIFEKRENRKIFELQKKQYALPTATRVGIKGAKRFLQNRFAPLKIPSDKQKAFEQ